MEPVLLYITAPNREVAISLSRELVHERLIACANIFESMTALYRWQGEIQHRHEAVVIAKTFTTHTERVIARVRDLHSDSTPCVLTMPVSGGSPEFIAWMQGEVKD